MAQLRQKRMMNQKNGDGMCEAPKYVLNLTNWPFRILTLKKIQHAMFIYCFSHLLDIIIIVNNQFHCTICSVT